MSTPGQDWKQISDVRGIPPVALVILLGVFYFLLWLAVRLARVLSQSPPAAPERTYHSEVSIYLPEAGEIRDAEYMVGLDTTQPRGLIVNKDDRGVVALPVKMWGRSTSTAYLSADINHDGFTTGADWDFFLLAFNAGEIGADFNGDGFVTGEDFDEFAAVFVSNGR